MGGLQVIFTGDFFQLPPVLKSQYGSQKGGDSGGYFTSQPHNFSRIDGPSSQSSAINPYSQPENSSSSEEVTLSKGQSIEQPLTTGYRPITNSLSQSLFAFPGKKSSGNSQTNRFCFQSPVWGDIISSTFVLTTVFRQSEASFVALLNSIRCGEITGVWKLGNNLRAVLFVI
jgi:hypothetical protein